MRNWIAALVFTGLLGASAHADTMKNCVTAWNAMSSADKAKTTYKAFSSNCLKKGVTAMPPAGATGQCKDGTYTTSKGRTGACSGHGGVARWL
ncbi:MAG: DUF3761 domain-containing protein [Rhizomicrobium sp.]